GLAGVPEPPAPGGRGGPSAGADPALHLVHALPAARRPPFPLHALRRAAAPAPSGIDRALLLRRRRRRLRRRLRRALAIRLAVSIRQARDSLGDQAGLTRYPPEPQNEALLSFNRQARGRRRTQLRRK